MTNELTIWSAQVTQKPDLTSVLKNLAVYQTAKDLKIADEPTMHQAIDLRASMKRDRAMLAEFKKKEQAYPKEQIKFINSMVNPIINNLDSMQKVLGERIQKKKGELEEEARKEALDTVEGVIAQNGDVQIVTTGQVQVVDPPNVVQTEGGAKVHTRGVPKVKVEDKLAMLKAIVSTAKGNMMWTLDLVDLRMGDIKKVAKEKAKGKKEIKIPGGKYWTEEILV